MDAWWYTLTPVQRWYMITLGFISYIDYWCFYKALQKLQTWIVIMISSLSILISYSLNSMLLPEIAFSIHKIIIAIMFFLLISVYIINNYYNKLSLHHILHNILHSITTYPYKNIYQHMYTQHMYTQTDHQMSTWYHSYLRAIISSVMASVLYVWIWYGIKMWIMSPYQASAIPDICTLLIALRAYGEHHKFVYHTLTHISYQQLGIYASIAWLSVLWSILVYQAIKYSDANTVSIIKLSTILLTPLCARYALWEKMKTMQTILTIIGIMLMILFILTP